MQTSFTAEKGNRAPFPAPLPDFPHARLNFDDVLVPIDEAYLYIGLKRSAIWYRMSKKSKYYDPRFPKPAPTPGNKTHFYRRDLVAYVRLLASDIAE